MFISNDVSACYLFDHVVVVVVMLSFLNCLLCEVTFLSLLVVIHCLSVRVC